MKKIYLLIIIHFILQDINSQTLFQLNAESSDPVFTTYAAPPERSSYKNDQGYSLKWNDPETNIEFISRQGPNTGIGFRKSNDVRITLERMHKQPVLTSSFSDLVSFFYYPYPGLRCEIFFDVWSSSVAFYDITIKNESDFTADFDVIPYLWYSSKDSVNDIVKNYNPGAYNFTFTKSRDSWMEQHSIPVETDIYGIFSGDLSYDSVTTFSGKPGREVNDISGMILSGAAMTRKSTDFVKGILGSRHLRMAAGDITSFRIIWGTGTSEKPVSNKDLETVRSVSPELLISEDEKAYSRIPVPKFSSSDLNLFYLSCFSLMRQCMMPAEGNLEDNYYVFSREPRWGWGYGGQVFHESLSMLAYVWMDPEGAMNSQRVYKSVQHQDGYINYRTGPYLNEDIPYDSTLTSSAPWYNYINLEIYKVTHDKKFLAEMYESGKRYYIFYTANRDSNNNGLCEWGGEASLESVRDARVAVWEQVGWPSNFEGPDVNSLLVMEAKSLTEIAGILGKKNDAALWKADAESRSEKINKFMWDSVSGFYYNINRDDQSFSFRKDNDLKIKEIIGFLPYWADITTPEQEKKLINVLKDSSEFWRPFGVPSLSASENYYNGIGYWNGPVWVQWNYLVFRGLLDHGDTNAAQSLAGKVIDNMIWHLKKDHTFWEFYSPDKRQAGWNQTYIWAGIAARFLIDLGEK